MEAIDNKIVVSISGGILEAQKEAAAGPGVASKTIVVEKVHPGSLIPRAYGRGSLFQETGSTETMYLLQALACDDTVATVARASTLVVPSPCPVTPKFHFMHFQAQALDGTQRAKL
jgi:hypothetical protein